MTHDSCNALDGEWSSSAEPMPQSGRDAIRAMAEGWSRPTSPHPAAVGVVHSINWATDDGFHLAAGLYVESADGGRVLIADDRGVGQSLSSGPQPRDRFINQLRESALDYTLPCRADLEDIEREWDELLTTCRAAGIDVHWSFEIEILPIRIEFDQGLQAWIEAHTATD